jgi:hypothetical protein
MIYRKSRAKALRFCLFIAAWAIFSYPAAVTITGDMTANLDI